MKFTVATVAAVLATGVLAQPMFTNSAINPQEGKPFTLTFSGCTGGCTITLQTGPSSQSLKDIRTLTGMSAFDQAVAQAATGSWLPLY